MQSAGTHHSDSHSFQHIPPIYRHQIHKDQLIRINNFPSLFLPSNVPHFGQLPGSFPATITWWQAGHLSALAALPKTLLLPKFVRVLPFGRVLPKPPMLKLRKPPPFLRNLLMIPNTNSKIKRTMSRNKPPISFKIAMIINVMAPWLFSISIDGQKFQSQFNDVLAEWQVKIYISNLVIFIHTIFVYVHMMNYPLQEGVDIMSAVGYGAYTSTGAILVLFILLVIISRAFVIWSLKHRTSMWT